MRLPNRRAAAILPLVGVRSVANQAAPFQFPRRPAKPCPLRRGSIARIFARFSFAPLPRGALAEPQPPPPINMAFTLFAHHAEGGAPSPFYVAIRLPDHSAMITRIVALMVSITLFSRMILSKKSATFWAHAGARPHVRNNPDH
jgi:hypothetical protein